MALGSYHLIACADDSKVVAEVDDGNNCTATSSTVQIALPDLGATSLTGVPAIIQRGKSFVVSETTWNVSPVASAATTTRYYLSKDTAKGAGDTLMTGSRAVPVLGAFTGSTGSATVTVPAGTVTGTYYVLACADDLNAVKEQSEANNCTSAQNTVAVTP